MSEHPPEHHFAIAPQGADSLALDESSTGHAPALTFDPEAYRQFVDGGDLSEEQQQEYLRLLWEIVVGFVDLGFQIHPVQLVTNGAKTLERDSSRVLVSQDISTSIQISAADLFGQAVEGTDS